MSFLTPDAAANPSLSPQGRGQAQQQQQQPATPTLLRVRQHPASALNPPQSSVVPLPHDDDDDNEEEVDGDGHASVEEAKGAHGPMPPREEEGQEGKGETQLASPLSAVANLDLNKGQDSEGARGADSVGGTGTGTPTTSITFSEPPSSHGQALEGGTGTLTGTGTGTGAASSSASVPMQSILRHSTSGTSSPPTSRGRSLEPSGTGAEADAGERLKTAMLKPPGTEATGTGSRTSSPSPAPGMGGDRSRIVGKGGYGGRKGGPSLTSKRTSSSGGLSDVDMRAGYERKVGFDTMRDADETNSGSFSFTLQVKSVGYMRTKNTRTFMCAVDDNAYSERALEWLVDGLVEDGDEVVALRVLEGDAEEIDQDEAREEARELMASIVQLNDEVQDRSISIVVEFVAGRVTSTILRLIHMYRPDSLTVGTRGKTMSAFQKMLGGATMGSCSRDILNRSPVPVVIVRPEAKVRKHLAKRANDPKRRSYHDLVSMSKEDSLPLSVGSRHAKSAIRRAKKS